MPIVQLWESLLYPLVAPYHRREIQMSVISELETITFLGYLRLNIDSWILDLLRWWLVNIIFLKMENI